MAGLKRKIAPTTFGSRTDVGCVRDHNEDSLVVAPPLYVVCDGMGGHAAGEVASEIAVRVIENRAPQHADVEELGRAVEEANLAIIRAAREGRGREGMGTTCTAAILEGERLVIAQVGDSRAYLLSKGRLQQLTRDHSLMADLIEAGHITKEEAKVHPQRSVITRALGSDPRMLPDLFELDVNPGDRLLICSDGLTTMLSDEEIAQLLARTADPQLCARQLVNAAIAAGGYDNVTVIVADVTGFTEVRRRKLTRRTRITAFFILVLLAAIIAAAVYGFSFANSHSAYLVEQNGKVAIYQGLQGEMFGISSSHLYDLTDVSVDDLQPGVANRLKTDGIKADGVEAAEAIVQSYRDEIAAKEKQQAEAQAAAEAAKAAGANDGSANATDSGAASGPSSGNPATGTGSGQSGATSSGHGSSQGGANNGTSSAGTGAAEPQGGDAA